MRGGIRAGRKEAPSEGRRVGSAPAPRTSTRAIRLVSRTTVPALASVPPGAPHQAEHDVAAARECCRSVLGVLGGAVALVACQEPKGGVGLRPGTSGA